MSQVGNYWLFVIDTDTYAGNFERSLTAWCTGQIGECGVGEEYAASFKEDHPEMIDVFEDLVIQIPDEHGCHRPTAAYPTPGYWNDGLGNHWSDEKWGSQEVQEKYMESVNKLKPMGPQPIGHYAAYQSVAIFFMEQPSQDIIKFLMQQALSYTPVGRFAQTFTITGFRVLQHIETETLVEMYPVPKM